MRDKVFTIIGARNFALEQRAENDFYATDPKAAEILLEKESFSHEILELACGEGHLAKVFENHGYNVTSTDLIDRGYGTGGVDFLAYKPKCPMQCDIITNPPYGIALEFVEHALDIVANGQKVAMFLKIQFLEGKARRALFDKYPPKVIYVSSRRLRCAKNGDFGKYAKSNAICYAWYVWVKGYTGDTVIKWVN